MIFYFSCFEMRDDFLNIALMRIVTRIGDLSFIRISPSWLLDLLRWMTLLLLPIHIVVVDVGHKVKLWGLMVLVIQGSWLIEVLFLTWDLIRELLQVLIFIRLIKRCLALGGLFLTKTIFFSKVWGQTRACVIVIVFPSKENTWDGSVMGYCVLMS